jgi:hypothetical protein
LLLVLCRLLVAVPTLSAQEWDEGEWDDYNFDLYSPGDQTIVISLGLIFPTVFVYSGGSVRAHNINPVGGAGSISYNYHLGRHLFLGGEIGGSFNGTLAKNNLFIWNFGIRGGWQFFFGRFEFPVALAFGMAPQSYIGNGYLGIYLRGQASAFFRFNPEWSFGLNTDWTWYPQRPVVDGRRRPDMDADGNFLGLTLAARYHF